MIGCECAGMTKLQMERDNHWAVTFNTKSNLLLPPAVPPPPLRAAASTPILKLRPNVTFTNFYATSDEKKSQVETTTKRKSADDDDDDPAPTTNESPNKKTKPNNGIISYECHICRNRSNTHHHFYRRLCPKCGDFNFEKRTQMAHPTLVNENSIAIVTGGRIKIGYEIVLMLLRSGYTVLTTTRFVADAKIRYESEKDAKTWIHRLELYSIDFRILRDVDHFCL